MDEKKEIEYTDKQQNTLHNLRSVGSIKIHEYIQCDDSGDILSFLEQSFVRCVSEDVFDNNCKNMYTSLDKLFIQELPKLIDNFGENPDELDKLGRLIESAILGLKNLGVTFQESKHKNYINKIHILSKSMTKQILIDLGHKVPDELSTL